MGFDDILFKWAWSEVGSVASRVAICICHIYIYILSSYIYIYIYYDEVTGLIYGWDLSI